MVDYCSASKLYDYGLPRGSIPNPGRIAESVDASADSITLGEHGFSAGDRVRFRAEAGGSLPTGLSAGVEYYAIPLTDSTFSVSLTDGGAAVDLSSAGARVKVIAPLPLDAAITWASRLVDDMLPAALVPLTLPVPPIVEMTTAELAIWKISTRAGSVPKSLGDIFDLAKKRLERWATGVPIRGENAPEPAGLAASASVPYLDPRGWNRFGGL